MTDVTFFAGSDMQDSDERLYLIDHEVYVFLQETDTGFDYSLYDAATMLERDGGIFDWDDLSGDSDSPWNEALNAVLELQELQGTDIEAKDLQLMRKIELANLQHRSAILAQMRGDNLSLKQNQGALADNYLKNAEMAAEDDYDQIDGIINNGPRQEQTIVDLLHKKLPESEHSTIQKSPTEMER